MFVTCSGMCLFLFFQPHALLNRVKNSISHEEQKWLEEISQNADSFTPTLLPIRTVGVQVRIIDIFLSYFEVNKLHFYPILYETVSY